MSSRMKAHAMSITRKPGASSFQPLSQPVQRDLVVSQVDPNLGVEKMGGSRLAPFQVCPRSTATAQSQTPQGLLGNRGEEHWAKPRRKTPSAAASGPSRRRRQQRGGQPTAVSLCAGQSQPAIPGPFPHQTSLFLHVTDHHESERERGGAFSVHILKHTPPFCHLQSAFHSLSLSFTLVQCHSFTRSLSLCAVASMLL